MSESELETIDALAENFQQWPGTQSRPTNPPILVTFEGLLDFYYNATGQNARTCGVGFQRADGHHLPKVSIFEDGQLWWGPIQIDNNSEVRFGTVNSAGQEQPANVEYLKNGGTDDIRWMIDMQSRSWYQDTQTAGHYAAKLFVRNGTFFTQAHTKYELLQIVKIEVGGIPYVPTAALGKPANVVADEILPAATQSVLLRVNGQEKLLPNNGKRYEVKFTNTCSDNTSNGPCDFVWWHFQEAKRNDFHHHRDALTLATFSAKYSVLLAPGQLEVGERDPARDRHDFNTNDAPCMGAGYGGGGGPS